MLMDVDLELIARVPAANLSVPRDEFGRVWATAERIGRRPGELFAAGVALTCRWMAGAPGWIRSPVFGREVRAEPEMIVEEVTAAVRELARAISDDRRRFLQGVVATFDWAWNGSGRPPVDLSTG
jgi:hypothetical protein